MVKRFLLFALSLVLVVGIAPFALANGDCDASDSHYARAVQLHDMGDYPRAERHYNCALAEDPDNPTIPILIENLHEDIASASTAWSRPVADCDASQDHSQLGQTAYARGDENSSLAHLHCALLVNPADADAAELMGHIHINRGSAHAAKHYYDRAAAARVSQSAESTAPQDFVMPDWLTPYELAPSAQTPELAPAPIQPIVIFTQRSQLLKQTDTTLVVRDGDMLTTWRRLQRTVVERVQVMISSGEMTLTLFSQRVYAMSVEARLTILPPQDSREAGLAFDDYLDFANWFSKRGDWGRAVKSLERALELQPRRHNLRCRLGALYRTIGDDDAALAQFELVLANDAGNTCAFENRQDMLSAVHSAAEPQALSPAQPIVDRAMSYLAANKLFAAANTLIEALATDPAHIDARCQLGMIFSDWSHYGRALREFERILAVEPNQPCAYAARQDTMHKMLRMYVPLTVDDFFYQARVYQSVEAWPHARDAYERGLALDTTRNDVRCQLGMIYAQLGDDRGALEQFDRVLAHDSLDACARPNRDALMQRLRDG